MQLTLSRLRLSVLSDEAVAAVRRLEDAVRLSLCGISERRVETLTRTARAQYRAALLERSTAAWQRFAGVLGDVMRTASEAPPESGPEAARDARLRVYGFLAENSDLGGNRSLTRPS
jgi:hypothetical protein